MEEAANGFSSGGSSEQAGNQRRRGFRPGAGVRRPLARRALSKPVPEGRLLRGRARWRSLPDAGQPDRRREAGAAARDIPRQRDSRGPVAQVSQASPRPVRYSRVADPPTVKEYLGTSSPVTLSKSSSSV